MRILVTGATGKVGRHLVEELHRGGHHVRALTRNPRNTNFPDGVEVLGGDLTMIETLGDAFEGVDAIHLITFGGDDLGDLTNGAELVDLAERKKVRRASVLGSWSRTSVETALKGSAIGWTLLHPVEFMANTFDWADELSTHGTLSTLATYPSAMVHEADIAAVAASALTEPGHDGRTYPLTGPEALTPQERIRILAETTGRDLALVQLTEAQERERLRGYGYDDDYVEFGINLATNPPATAGKVLSTVQDVTGGPARTFAQWAQENAAGFLPRDAGAVSRSIGP
ncbi:NAD-dependent epimerase/dehydratase family protein [Occultella glacieicola]|uniref:NAD-dependent epimerase/dehydratase family protein n=1 Tax=Occultella glacieicola TaxID=2518684 RepID=A0ABY2E8R7_9MICO|nr:NAD(P)H-binding protein [Occultella glacieicola]TDE98882.1 NAD-dependent epimerase/dehydratase family protein [Occultella glacieicola]